MQKPWLLDELAHAGAEHLDTAFVVGYDQKQGHPDPADDIETFVTYGLGADSVVVDLGAGTGQFALTAARRFGRVTAVEVSTTVLDALSAKAKEAGLPNVETRHAGFLSYEHSGGQADGVYTRNALHQIPDVWKAIALQRISAFMRPGGVLRVRDLVYDCTPGEAEALFDEWLEGAVQDPARGYTRDDFAEHIRTEHSTFRWLFEPMLLAAGFRIESAQFERRIYAAYTCIKV
jgi:SAM-dependent methyltransferase